MTRFILLLLAAWPTYAGSPEAEAQAEMTIRQARAALSQGHLQRGSALLGQALEDPSASLSLSQRAELLLLRSQAEINLGRYLEGLDAARESLITYRELADERGEAQACFRVGTANDELAQYDESRRHYQCALDLFRSQEDRAGEGRVLSAFGTSYRFLGDPATARRYYTEALELFTELGETAAASFEHRHLGLVLEDLGLPGDAESQYRRAMALLPSSDSGWGKADLLFHLGRLRGRTVRPEDGLILLREGLDLARSSENRWAEAQILVELGRLRGERGDVDGGLLAAGQAVSLFTRMGARDQEWSARLVHGRLLERAGRIEDAAAAYRAALEALDEVRSKIGLPLLRSRYTPRSRLVYEALLQLEARRPGADDAAATTFEIAEQYRARTFTEMLIASRDTNLAGDSALRDEERTVRGKINALRTRLTRFPATVADRESVENELRDAERRHETLQVELQHTEPRYRPEPARVLSTPANAQALLGAGDRLVAYHLGEHGSLAWTLEDDRVALTKLPGRAQIENLVLVFRSLGVHRNDPAALRRVSRRLYDLLLAPLAERIEGGRSLVVIPDGALFYLPFEALRPPAADGRERFLLHDFSVSYIPSVAALAELRERRRPAAELDLLAFGDPTSQDPAMEPRLTHSGSEVRRISMLFDPSRSARLTGPEARESVFRDRARAPTTIVHLATHGVLDGGRPERSGLVFAPEDDPQGDGFLGLFEIFDLTVSADLVVLSGCDTARGELLRGEGILGLTRGFLFAGSRSVLASLWRVDDRSTEELMVTFYGHLARGHTTSQALRRAKLDWLAAAGGQAADPYAWASFVLVGDGDLTIPGLAPRRRTSVVLIVVGVVLLLVAFVAGRGGTGRRISLP